MCVGSYDVFDLSNVDEPLCAGEVVRCRNTPEVNHERWDITTKRLMSCAGHHFVRTCMKFDSSLGSQGVLVLWSANLLEGVRGEMVLPLYTPLHCLAERAVSG